MKGQYRGLRVTENMNSGDVRVGKGGTQTTLSLRDYLFMDY